MKIVQINTVCGSGSTGKICVAVSELLNGKQIENYILYTSGTSDHPNAISCGNWYYTKLQALKSRILGNYGFNSAGETRRMIREMERIRPDIVHLHNIHGHDCHLEILFDYLKKRKIKVFWTFHDCWAFTGYCPHYTLAGCDKWKTGCGDCPQRKKFSWFSDRSAELYARKRAAFSGADLTIITPSQWLADQVKESFLQDVPVHVIHNGIDLEIFQPTPSDFRKKYGIPEEKYILLGVAFGWGVRKGLDVFIDLAGKLDEHYQIVLVGTDDKVDRQLPDNIISIHRTENQRELAAIYTAADLFVNPTREEVLGLVNIEALACGTPVITFRTGGSPEIADEKSGAVTANNDADAILHEIIRICAGRVFRRENCIKRAEAFNKDFRFNDYLKLYIKYHESDK